MLLLVDILSRTVYITGSLGNIPPVIHFARWHIIDKKHHCPRMIFFSNFDGSWDSYLGDFVDTASWAFTGIWGNTIGFPRTRWLFFEGAKHIVEFKDWSRKHNLYANVWYNANPNETVRNIVADIRVAEKIGKLDNMTKDEAERWLSIL